MFIASILLLYAFPYVPYYDEMEMTPKQQIARFTVNLKSVRFFFFFFFFFFADIFTVKFFIFIIIIINRIFSFRIFDVMVWNVFLYIPFYSRGLQTH